MLPALRGILEQSFNFKGVTTVPDQSIVCPKCGTSIQLSEALTHDIEEKLRGQFESEMFKKDAEYQRLLESNKQEFRAAFNREKTKLELQASEKAQETVAVELKDLRAQNEEKRRQLEESDKRELEMRKRQREIEERERNLKLEVERTLESERKAIWSEAVTKTADENRLREMEKDKQLADMRKQIEELKHKAELTSQQVQGEVQELELESILAAQFRYDKIEPVAKGIRGADAIQLVCDEMGRPCGKIIWESKRTKAWSDGWVQKLKDDQRNSKAEIAVIVSSSLPKELHRFGFYEGIWVTDFSSVVGLATALRLNLIQLSYAQESLQGKNDKMELVYRYLSSSEFRQRVEAIVESIKVLRDDLYSERAAMERTWAKREKQLDRVFQNTAGFYGDLQGIIGKTIPDVKILELPGNGSDS